MRKTGPNDASSVVWALGKFFLNYFRVFLILTNVLLCIGPVNYEIDTGSVATRKTGPNDARRVVWALGKSFFLMCSCFLILTNALF